MKSNLYSVSLSDSSSDEEGEKDSTASSSTLHSTSNNPFQPHESKQNTGDSSSFNIDETESHSFRIPATCSQQVSSDANKTFKGVHVSLRKEKSHQTIHINIPESFPTYYLITKRKHRSTGKSAVYQFTDVNRHILYEAKQNRKHPTIYDIFTSGTTNIVAALIISSSNAGEDNKPNTADEFSFRKYNKRGPELMAIRYQSTHRNFRKAIVTFMYASSDKKPQRLRSRDPPLDNDGKPMFNFGDSQPFMDSPRNLVLYSRHQDKTYITVRKIDSNELQIDAMFRANLLWLVAISLSDAICPVC